MKISSLELEHTEHFETGVVKIYTHMNANDSKWQLNILIGVAT